MKMVMIVDDEEMSRTLITKILKKEGYEVFSAESGRDACGMIEEITPDLVIMDMMMPDMDGFALAEAMRGGGLLPSRVPILMLSGYPGELNRKNADKCGIDAYMEKPFDIRTLVTKVEKLTTVDKNENWFAIPTLSADKEYALCAVE